MATQRTPLHEFAVERGAGFTEWYGWRVPRAYGDVKLEYGAARDGAALHDSSYTGRIKATGEDVLDLLHRLSTNELVSLQPGQGAPTVLTTDRGRILDVITVINLGDHVLVLTSPQMQDKVIEWIDKYTIVDDVTLEDVTATSAVLSLIGPKVGAFVGRLAGLDVGSFLPYQAARATLGGVDCNVFRRDLVGLAGFDVVVDREHVDVLWRELIEAGALPMGVEAHEALRVEVGAPAYGKELGEAYNPLEAGLWGSISFTKGCYIGQEVVARLDTYQKVQRHLVSLVFSSGALVQEGMALALEGREVGHITSAARVPTTGTLVGLGYVRKEASDARTRLDLADLNGAWAKVEAPVLPFGPGDTA